MLCTRALAFEFVAYTWTPLYFYDDVKAHLLGVGAGCLENVHGFYPLRNRNSKWYISYEEMPDEVVRCNQLIPEELVQIIICNNSS